MSSRPDREELFMQIERSLEEMEMHCKLNMMELENDADMLEAGGLDSDELSSSSGTDDDDSGEDGDNESETDEEDGFEGSSTMSSWARLVVESIEELYCKQYNAPQDEYSRPPGTLLHTLEKWSTQRPDQFHEDLCVSPSTFWRLHARIQDDPIFTNQSQNDQMPVSHQLAILLYRLRHYRNSASLKKAVNWSSYAKDEEKQEAKEWVRQQLCMEFEGGWCMVDGMLVTLDQRLYWYGLSYWDRKNNYSLNIQIINMPNLRIIDFGFGHVGSTHDAMAWDKTYFTQHPKEFLNENEFIWADSAYPVH
ncbi:hypothetical protein V5O48_012120 [Marasmius crinis-equi]|uniref:DDE Tnp4 domain-containing protein n=1 Tax=Marasmius crinis-equi TaxID=585013 RepID=A0ABR3F3S8_9AGAR